MVVEVPTEERPPAGGHRAGRPPAAGRTGAVVGRSHLRVAGAVPIDMAYAELHAHSNFSFLDGASHPEELAAEAVRLGLSGLALTDHNGLYGVVRFAEAARAFGLPTVFGAELTITGCRPGRGPHRGGRPRRHPPGRAGPGPRGVRLDSAGCMAEAHLAGGEKGKPIITLDALSDRHGGHWQILTGCRKGALATALTAEGPAAAAPRPRSSGRAVRPRPPGRRALGSRQSDRRLPQRRPGPVGHRAGRGPGGHQQRALRHPGPASP